MITEGTVLRGFQGMAPKVVEAIGPDWVVARNVDGGTPVAVVISPEELQRYVRPR